MVTHYGKIHIDYPSICMYILEGASPMPLLLP